MSELSRRVYVLTIVSFVLGLGATLTSITAYSLARSTQTAATITSTRTSIGEKFNWSVGEVVDVNGNFFAYRGFEVPVYVEAGGFLYSVHLTRWQNAWIEVSYSFFTQSPEANVTLSPYKLHIQEFNNNYLTATFFES